MKERIVKCLCSLTAIFFLLVSCQPELLETSIPKIIIEELSSDNQSTINVKFVPYQDAVSFDYAIMMENDTEGFTDNSVNGIIKVDNSEELTISFDSLELGRYYYIYAKSYDENGESGPVAMLKIYLALTNQFKAELKYVLSSSAAIEFTYPTKYYGCDYYLGTKSDRDAFYAGTLNGIQTLGEIIQKYTLTMFDIEENKDYVFYAKSYSITGDNEYIEIPFTTPSATTSPDYKFEITYQDPYRLELQITPNDQTKKLTFHLGERGWINTFALEAMGYAGDWVSLLRAWDQMDSQDPRYATFNVLNGNTYVLKINDIFFSHRSVMDMHGLLYDNDSNVAGVKRTLFEKNYVPTNVKPTSIDIEVSDITSTGATIKYNTDENTLGYFYEIVVADWLDEKMASSEWTDHYMHNYLYSNFGPGFWIYAPDQKDGEYEYIERKASPDTRYYAVACPVNFEGHVDGWEDLVMVEFTTKKQ